MGNARGLVVVAVLAVVQGLGLRPSNALRLHPGGRTGVSGTALQSMGSDVLQRPEDEDGPEFREYLKALMKMQLNRAKTGHAAPSSGSSDAYIAKLNRIKVERLALLKAGLPDAEIDTSYKPEDYQAALFEAAEPMVASAVLTGDAAIARPGRQASKGKVRQLTDEEIATAKSAEEKVQAALARQGMLPSQTKSSDSEYRDPIERLRASVDDESPEMDLIDTVLNQRSLKNAPQVTMTSQGRTPPPAVPKPMQAQPQPVMRAAAATPPRPMPLPPAASAPPKPSASYQQQLRAQEAAIAAPIAPRTPTQAAPMTTSASSSGFGSSRKLAANELEVAGEALKFLVKHRGGGPFGAGRFQGEGEVEGLESALRAAAEMLERDTEKAFGPVVATAAAPTPAKFAPPAPAPVPVQLKQQQQQPAAPKANWSKPPAPAPMPAPVIVSVPAPATAHTKATPPSESEAVPISVGLDQFLDKPKEMEVGELSALRDGLIQVLGMLTMEIASRPPAGAGAATPAPPVSHLPSQSTLDQATNRIASMTAGSESSSGPPNVTAEIKLALGLLLKHRGGPGFGHGRLDGHELVMLENKLKSAALLLEAEAKASVKK